MKTTDLRRYHVADDDAERLEGLYADYKLFYTNPSDAIPKVVIDVPVDLPNCQKQLCDPLVMLEAQLKQIQAHLEIGDDYTPMVRVNFGTGQVAAAFGTEIIMVEDSLPAADAPIIKNIDDIEKICMPAPDAGWYGKLKKWTQIWLENIPEGVHIQHPDIQSAFNTAHLMRGNDILTDFYDDPDAIERLLDKITDYMIELTPQLKAMISDDKEWFFDWSALWKGCARISNCSTTMIGPDFYERYVLPRDKRLLNSLGGGRMHYCGNSSDVIKSFLSISGLTGLDCDCQYHDLWNLAHITPPHVTLIFQQYGSVFPFTDRLLRGDWPEKRNIIIMTKAESITEGKNLFFALKNSIPYL
jgi:uroporphyrinogen-III decarboxylase